MITRFLSAVVVLLAAQLGGCSAPTTKQNERQAVRIDRMIAVAPGMEATYRWQISTKKDDSSPTGYYVPRTCAGAIADLQLMLPAEYLSMVHHAIELARVNGKGGVRAISREETSSNFEDAGFTDAFLVWLHKAWGLSMTSPFDSTKSLLEDCKRAGVAENAEDLVDALLLAAATASNQSQ